MVENKSAHCVSLRPEFDPRTHHGRRKQSEKLSSDLHTIINETKKKASPGPLALAFLRQEVKAGEGVKGLMGGRV